MPTELVQSFGPSGVAVVDAAEQRVQRRYIATHTELTVTLVPDRTPPRVFHSEEPPRLVPGELWLGALRNPQLRVRQPFRLSLTRDGEHVVAEAVEVNEFGWGPNMHAAVEDLQRALAELFFGLEADQGRLGPDLRAVWAVMQEKLSRRV